MVTSQGSLTFLPSRSPSSPPLLLPCASPRPTAPGEGRRDSLRAAGVPAPRPVHGQAAGKISKPGARLSKPAVPLPRLPPSFLHHSLAPLRSCSPPPRAEEAREASQKTPRTNKRQDSKRPTQKSPSQTYTTQPVPSLTPTPASAGPASPARPTRSLPPRSLLLPRPPPPPAPGDPGRRREKSFPWCSAPPLRLSGDSGAASTARAPKGGAGSQGKTE